jgi:hypothetical protein
VYVIIGMGRTAAGDTPKEATEAWRALRILGPAQMVRTPGTVTRETLDAELRRGPRFVPEGSGDDDSWIMIPPPPALVTAQDLWASSDFPRTVPGYAEALATGQVSLPPLEPPIPLPGLASSILSLGTAIGPVVAILILVSGLVRDFVGATILFAAVAGWIFVLGRVSRARLYDELAAGYIAWPTIMVSSGPGKDAERWNYRGTWVLTPDGQVKSAPDRAFDAPGFYPAPNRPGQLQLWTGLAWVPRFRDPRIPAGTSAPGITRW